MLPKPDRSLPLRQYADEHSSVERQLQPDSPLPPEQQDPNYRKPVFALKTYKTVSFVIFSLIT